VVGLSCTVLKVDAAAVVTVGMVLIAALSQDMSVCVMLNASQF